MKSKTAGVILAAGKGTRLNSTDKNKVMMPLNGKPMIGHSVDILEKAEIAPIVVVVGFAKEGVIDYLGGRVLYAEQTKQLGTAHAAIEALKKLPGKIGSVLIVYGDDSYCYPPKLLHKLITLHDKKDADLTMLTVFKNNPSGLGRILRNDKGEVEGIVEEKNATSEQRKIKEINTGCYVFDRDFLSRYLPKVDKNPVSGEYYLTDLVELAVKNNETIAAVKGEDVKWRGVNTHEELKQARKIVKNQYAGK